MSENKEYTDCRKEENGWASLGTALNMPDSNAEDQLIQVEDRAILEKVLPNLKDRWQQIIRDRYFDNLTLDETGRKYGITREAVRTMQIRALKNLKKQLEKRVKPNKNR